jgi:ribonuclease BN (tRNA processing enzyme)
MGSSTGIVIGDRTYLVDCGPGVVRRAEEASRRGLVACEPARLQHLFLTHLHVDHTGGLADVLFTPWILGRPRPLRVLGPEGTRAMTEHVLAAYEEDRRARVEGREPIDPAGFGAEVREVEPGRCFEDDRVRVDAIEVDHGPTWRAYSYRFRTDDRDIVISGDTHPHAAAIDAWVGCDVLVHEVYSRIGFESRPPEWQRYHATMHTSTRELVELTRRVSPRLLVLSHVLLWGQSVPGLLAECEGAVCPVVCGEDLGVY